MDEAGEVLDVVFPSGDEAAEVVHPGKESLHLPAFPIAAELATILCSASPSASIRCNQFDPVLFRELGVDQKAKPKCLQHEKDQTFGAVQEAKPKEVPIYEQTEAAGEGRHPIIEILLGSLQCQARGKCAGRSCGAG